MIPKDLIDKEMSLLDKWDDKAKSVSIFSGIGSLITISCLVGYLFIFSSSGMNIYDRFFILLIGINALSISLVPFLKTRRMVKLYNFYREQLVKLADENSDNSEAIARINYICKHKFIRKDQIHEAIVYKINGFDIKFKKSVYKIILHTAYIFIVIMASIQYISSEPDFKILSMFFPIALVIFSIHAIINYYQQKNNFKQLANQWKHHLEKIQEKAYDAELVEILNDTLCNPEKIVVIE